MLYHFVASDIKGKLVEGDMDAGNMEAALRALSEKNLRPVSIDPLRMKKSFGASLVSGINLADKVFLTKYLSLMLKVGTDLLSAINILIADFEKPAMKNLLLEVRDNLTKGRPFYQAFSSHSRVFSSVFVNLVKAAEASGNLQETFENLSVSMEKESQLRNKIKSALIYPIIILVASLGIFVFLSTFALPKIAKVFMDSGLNPPVFSRIVFSVGLFFGENVFIILPILLALMFAAIMFFFKTQIGKDMGLRILSKTPFVSKIYRDLAMQRFASTFSSLMRAGLPIVEAVHITADVVGASEYKSALKRIADEGLSKGLTMGDAFKKETVFPRVLTNLVAISEKAGHLDEVLETIADFYADSVDTNVKNLVSFLEPMMLLGMGLLVGIIAISIIVPIYQLTSQF